MRRTPSSGTLAIAVILAAALGVVGCSSRKQTTTADTAPPPPPPPTESPAPVETPPPPAAEPTDTGGDLQSRLQDAFFDYDDASIRADAKEALEGNGKVLQGASGSVIIEGHCDERGSVEYNLALGERRARAAKDFLASYGVPADRMTTISYGKERPFDPGHSEEAWAKNRRAHFVAK